MWASGLAVEAELQVLRGTEAEGRQALRLGILDILANKRPDPLFRPYNLELPVWLARFVWDGTYVTCGYGPLGADADDLRFKLRDLAEHAVTYVSAP